MRCVSLSRLYVFATIFATMRTKFDCCIDQTSALEPFAGFSNPGMSPTMCKTARQSRINNCLATGNDIYSEGNTFVAGETVQQSAGSCGECSLFRGTELSVQCGHGGGGWTTNASAGCLKAFVRENRIIGTAWEWVKRHLVTENTTLPEWRACPEG